MRCTALSQGGLRLVGTRGGGYGAYSPTPCHTGAKSLFAHRSVSPCAHAWHRQSRCRPSAGSVIAPKGALRLPQMHRWSVRARWARQRGRWPSTCAAIRSARFDRKPVARERHYRARNNPMLVVNFPVRNVMGVGQCFCDRSHLGWPPARDAANCAPLGRQR